MENLEDPLIFLKIIKIMLHQFGIIDELSLSRHKQIIEEQKEF